MATANAAAATTAIVYIVCRLLVGLFPDISMNVAKSWFHGIDISKISAWNLSLESFILGIITASITAWLVGYVFATFYNYFIKRLSELVIFTFLHIVDAKEDPEVILLSFSLDSVQLQSCRVCRSGPRSS